MSYLRYLCLFAHSDVQHILCCVFVFVLFYLVLCTLCCPLLIVPSVFSKVYWLNVTEYLCYKWPRICCYGIYVLHMTTNLLLRNICVTNDHGFVVTEYMCYTWPRICCYGISVLQMTTDLLLWNICVTNDHGFVPFLCDNHNSVMSSCMTYHGVYNKSNTMDATNVAGTVYPTWAPEFTPGF